MYLRTTEVINMYASKSNKQLLVSFITIPLKQNNVMFYVLYFEEQAYANASLLAVLQ